MKSPLERIRSWRRMPYCIADPFRSLSARFRKSDEELAPPSAGNSVAFVCNLCNASNSVAPERLAREVSSCSACGSTVRFRTIAWLVAREVLGEERGLPDLPHRPDLVGIGLSDAQSYAVPLGRAFTYTNTFYDSEPRLDITAVPDALAGRHDFVIASDVFEHVAPPIARAFHGARRLLKPNGVFIMTVPFSYEPETTEHFPDLHDYRIVRTGDGKRLHNTTRDGRSQVFENLIFHGGVGATLEMRVFSKPALERTLQEAGFSRIDFVDEPCPRFGIVRPEPSGVPIVARP